MHIIFTFTNVRDRFDQHVHPHVVKKQDDLTVALQQDIAFHAQYCPGTFTVEVKSTSPKPAKWLDQLKRFTPASLALVPFSGETLTIAPQAEERPIDLYDPQYTTIPDKYPQPEDMADYEAEQRAAFASFVGTHDQVMAEKEAMLLRISGELKRRRDQWQALLDGKVKTYWEAAYAEQADIHERVLGFLYSRAYERGHSGGHTEVYGYFREYCNNYRDLKGIEKELGL